MTFARDALRDARQKIVNECTRLGINLDEERMKYGDTRALMIAARNLINNATPRSTLEQLVQDAPPIGAFDGGNTMYTLSAPVAGQNIRVVWGDTAGNKTIPLQKTNESPPPADGFYFVASDPTHITVGTPPQAGDMLVAIYKTR
jgi:hypothetical protein